MVAAFSILLNGIEALGSFLPFKKALTNEHYPKKGENYFGFKAFIVHYLKDWDIMVEGTAYKDKISGSYYEKVYLPLILWDHFRNGIAHAFVVEGGGIDYRADHNGCIIEENRQLEIGPIKFFNDFLNGVENFFEDVKSKYRSTFLERFKNVYPS